MGRYLARRRYSARGNDGQPLSLMSGTEVDLSEADADWVNRDSPGTLELIPEPDDDDEPAESAEVEPDGDESDDEPDDELEVPAEVIAQIVVAQPAKDRQHRGGRGR